MAHIHGQDEEWTEVSLPLENEGKGKSTSQEDLTEWDIVVDVTKKHLDEASDALCSFSEKLTTTGASLGELSRQVQDFKDQKSGAELLWAWSHKLSRDIAHLSRELEVDSKLTKSDNSKGVSSGTMMSSEFHRCHFRASFCKQERQLVASKLDDLLANDAPRSEEAVPDLDSPGVKLSEKHLDRLMANWELGWSLLKQDVILGSQAKQALLQCQQEIKTAH